MTNTPDSTTCSCSSDQTIAPQGALPPRAAVSYDLNQLRDELTTMVQELLDAAHLCENDVFVLGCSTSEIAGGVIGKDSRPELGTLVISTLLELLAPLGVYLAVQGCEHINRALVLERKAAKRYGYEIVQVVPQLHAGGACSVAAFELFEDPVEVEHIVAKAGIDIGDTEIGMHVAFVQVPFRTSIQTLGAAHVTALRSRPKYIGGPRAGYAH